MGQTARCNTGHLEMTDDDDWVKECRMPNVSGISKQDRGTRVCVVQMI